MNNSQFATIVRAETGWQVALARHPDHLVFVHVDFWGMTLDGKFHPLDNARMQLDTMPNFVEMLNSDPTKEELNALQVKCEYIADKLGWKRDK